MEPETGVVGDSEGVVGASVISSSVSDGKTDGSGGPKHSPEEPTSGNFAALEERRPPYVRVLLDDFLATGAYGFAEVAARRDSRPLFLTAVLIDAEREVVGVEEIDDGVGTGRAFRPQLREVCHLPCGFLLGLVLPLVREGGLVVARHPAQRLLQERANQLLRGHW